MKKRISIILILAGLIFLVMIFWSYWQDPMNHLKQVVTLELGEPFDPACLIKSYTSSAMREHLLATMTIDPYPPDVPGTYTSNLHYAAHSQTIQIQVKDTTAPQFIDPPSQWQMVARTTPDFSQLIIEDRSPYTVTIDQTDFSTPGTYQTELIATDSSQNQNRHPITLIIEAPQITLSSPSDLLACTRSMQLELAGNLHWDQLQLSSSDERIASIDAKGCVTAHQAGEVTFSACLDQQVLTSCTIAVIDPPASKNEFVNIKAFIPDLYVDLKYASTDNFTQTAIYDFHDAYLRYGTVQKLIGVQEDLKAKGYRLLIWDAYRPFEAQKRLWEVVPDDRYVANPAYGPQSHNLGSTIDASLVTSEGTSVPMPTAFDDFSSLADRDYRDIQDPQAIENALLLEQTMTKHGFRGYALEWWDYSDSDSYTYLDFQVP